MPEPLPELAQQLTPSPEAMRLEEIELDFVSLNQRECKLLYAEFASHWIGRDNYDEMKAIFNKISALANKVE